MKKELITTKNNRKSFTELLPFELKFEGWECTFHGSNGEQ